MGDPGRERWSAVLLTGGRGSRLGGRDKAALTVGRRAFLDRALDAVSVAAEVVVVGEEPRRSDPSGQSSARQVRHVREEPAHGGPAAGLLAGLDALTEQVGTIVVLAVDMPMVSTTTVDRLLAAVGEHDGAALLHQGRRQLALAARVAALHRVAPPPAERSGLPVHRLLAGLDLAEVIAGEVEGLDVDTWGDLRRARRAEESGAVNLHDWIDELCDALDIETEVDEGLLLDVARSAAENVQKTAAPVSAYLLGFAAGAAAAGPEDVDAIAGRLLQLADGWDRPAGLPEIEDQVPDDSGIDHSGDSYAEPDEAAGEEE